MNKTLSTIFFTRVWPTRYAVLLMASVALLAWGIHPARANSLTDFKDTHKTKVVNCSKSEAHDNGGVCILHE
jgi:hypothetical protein